MIKICFAYKSKKKLSYSKFGFYVVRLIALCIDFFEPGTFGAIELRCVADIRTTLGLFLFVTDYEDQDKFKALNKYCLKSLWPIYYV